MLQKFLDAGLLQIEDETEKFASLSAAAQTVAASLKATPAKLITSTLIALDPEAPKDDPIIVEVEAAVKVAWTTVRARYKETPIQNYRGVLWESLKIASQGNVRASAIIWLVGGSYLPLSRLENRARPICREFLTSLGQVAEAEAAKLWALKTDFGEIKLPRWSPANLEVKYGTVDRETLSSGLSAAATNLANRIHPQHFPPWLAESAPKAAAAIGEAVDAAMKSSAESLTSTFSKIDVPLKNHIAAVNVAVKEAIERAVASVVAQQRRNALLWWKETLYSESRKRGYRGLNSTEVAILMALDLHREVLPFAPQSIEYLLRESIRDALPGGIVPIALSSFIDDLTRDENQLSMLELLPEFSATGRSGLLNFARGVLANQWPATDLLKHTGLRPEQLLSPEELSVLLFNDLQARRLVEKEW
jgi:cation transport regulator ChaB